MCVYVCVYMSMCVHVCAYVYMYVSISYVCVCILCIYVCLCVYLYVCVYERFLKTSLTETYVYNKMKVLF